MEQNQTKAALYKRWGNITLILGLLGIIDITTKGFVPANLDMGGIGFVVLMVGAALAGAGFGASLAVFVSTTLDLSLGWLVVSYFLFKKSRLLEAPTEATLKSLKRAKILLYILGVIIILILAATFLSVLSQ